jgi:choline dehydrogenase-like flavoprotein
MADEVVDTRQEFDYVIVGAGSAGCVLAACLSEDSNVRVALPRGKNTGRQFRDERHDLYPRKRS